MLRRLRRLVDHGARPAEGGHGIVVFLLHELEEKVQFKAAVLQAVLNSSEEFGIQVLYGLSVVRGGNNPVPVGILKGIGSRLRIQARVPEDLDDIQGLADDVVVGIRGALQAGKGKQLVSGGREVDVGGPCQFFALDIDGAQGQLHALVLDRGIKIRLQGRKAGGSRKRDADQLAGGTVAVPCPGQVDPVIEKAGFQRDLELPVFFPAEGRVVKAGGLETGHAEVVRPGGGIGIQVLVIADLVASRGAVAGAQLSEAEQAAVRHPAFLGEYPCGAHRPEISELAPGPETARAVPPSRQVQQQATVPVQVGAREYCLVLVHRGLVEHDFRIGGRGQVVDEAVGREAAAQLCQLQAVLLLEGGACQEFQAQGTEFLLPVQLRLGNPRLSGGAARVDRGELRAEAVGRIVDGGRGRAAFLVVKAGIAQAGFCFQVPGELVGKYHVGHQVAGFRQ